MKDTQNGIFYITSNLYKKKMKKTHKYIYIKYINWNVN